MRRPAPRLVWAIPAGAATATATGLLIRRRRSRKATQRWMSALAAALDTPTSDEPQLGPMVQKARARVEDAEREYASQMGWTDHWLTEAVDPGREVRAHRDLLVHVPHDHQRRHSMAQSLAALEKTGPAGQSLALVHLDTLPVMMRHARPDLKP